jgi:hypothetical protein
MFIMKYAFYVCCSISVMLFASGSNAGSVGQGNVGQGLEQQVSPDERERMHKDLDDYANKAYPDSGRMEERRHKLRDRFTQADLNEDGLISREEAEQKLPGLASHFDEIDTDNDGTISREELQAAEDKIREEKSHSGKEDRDLLAHEEGDPDATPPPKKKRIKHPPKPPPPPDTNNEGS